VRIHQTPGRGRDAHVATLRSIVMKHDAPGCAVESNGWVNRRAKQSDMPLVEFGDSAEKHSDLALANDAGELLERVDCWIDSPRGQTRGMGRSSSPRCKINFKPFESVALVPDALIEEIGTTRARRAFAMPAWLD